MQAKFKIILNQSEEMKMAIREIVETLIKQGYPIALIARQCDMQYMDLYRSVNQGRPFRDHEIAAIKRFAIVQPFMEKIDG